MRKTLALILAVMMVLSAASFAFAEETTEVGTPRKSTLIVETQTPTDCPGQFNSYMNGTQMGFGIVGMASKRSTDGIVQLMGRENLGRGVKVRANGEKVDIDLFIIVEYGISISAVAASIIETVKYKVERLAGIPVGRVNVCVEDIRV